MMVYLSLFIEFFKIGLFAIGGGMATLPFLMELTTKYDWYTTAEMADMIAISQSTPGPIGINMATYAGFHAAGISGALVATLSLVLPAIVIIIIIARFLENFSENPIVKSIFYGIRPTVAALIGYAVLELLKIALFSQTAHGYVPDYTGIVICIVFFICLQLPRFKKIHPLFWMVGGACIGIILKL